MQVSLINDRFSVSDQITPDDVAILAQQGVTELVNMRPDEEVEPHLRSDAIAAAAQQANMAYVYLPIVPGMYAEDAVNMLRTTLNGCNHRVHSYCRSGNRVMHVWALANALGKSSDALLAECAKAPCDLASIKSHLEQHNLEQPWLGMHI
ncbi:TIGR01244 family phosphatase [Aestuariibacter halophilus]|uniref:TIGR01244 family phosphatase n=1 Tax=Fluctibacter halophilus TaxID=226011 RepID=A0ABS8GBF7_9ALTE|nr:TIGR01244 family sulfur transferase [Aestuariibacter halophilus]MCC2617920.1 TIGR01244 family phosphatase [Aestuariibacter halophilus]